MAKTTDKIQMLISPVVQDMGYELVGIEYVASGKHSVLRVYIDSDSGISLSDCENVSHQISAIFAVEDPISGQYNLEVSSPGVERGLFCIEHYQRFLGYDIKLRLVRSINGRRKFIGAIGSVSETDNQVELITELGAIKIDIGLIEKANLLVNF